MTNRGEEPRSLVEVANRAGQALSDGARVPARIPGGSRRRVRGSILDDWRGGCHVGGHECHRRIERQDPHAKETRGDRCLDERSVGQTPPAIRRDLQDDRNHSLAYR